MEHPPATAELIPDPTMAGQKKVPFGVNEMRLTGRQWLLTFVIVGLVVFFTPRVWKHLERFDTGPDYRIPYSLSKDYWLYSRWIEKSDLPGKVFLLGDSVIWGEYVLPDGTLSHFLNQVTGSTNRFINDGLNGLFPLAEEGLVSHYSPLRRRKVILHCNVLWMTSPKADLSSAKEEQFNHAALVPQFHPRIPCYRADANERLSIVLAQHSSFISWVGHLQQTYYDQKSIPNWTLADDGGSPPAYPNAWKNPFKQITSQVPRAPAPDPERGPASPRHKPWSTDGQGTTRFEWVSLDQSLQWQAFQRVVAQLRQKGNDVLVLLGPFNEHMLAEENRPAFLAIRGGIIQWLQKNQVPAVIPETLPSPLYADASHPLTAGYEMLARRICADQTFKKWVREKSD